MKGVFTMHEVNMFDYEKHGVFVGQFYNRADGAFQVVKVIDTESYKHCGDVVVQDVVTLEKSRIDAWKLKFVRFCLIEENKY